MKISSNELGSAVAYFKNELASFYDISELESILYILFQYYFGVSKTDNLFQTRRRDTRTSRLGIQDINE